MIMDRFDEPNTKRVLTGIWIAFLYILCMFLVVYSLSTYQFQMGLNLIPKNMPNAEPKLINHQCDISSLKYKPNNKSLIAIPCIPNTLVETDFYSTSEILAIYTRYATWINHTITPLLEKQKRFDSKLKDVNEEIEDWTSSTITQLREDQKYYASELKDVNEEIKNNQVNEALMQKKSGASSNIDRIKKEIRDLDNNVPSVLANKKFFLHNNVKRIKGEIRDLDDDKAKQLKKIITDNNLGEALYDIQYFESLFNVLSSVFETKSFWALPIQILTILLICSMGILGSLIFITIEFIKDSECHTSMRCSMYIFRPFLGMIVALAMYVMVKSGQSTFSDTSAETLSPFTLSFLGIISGMLAEQAYKSLTITGSTVLNGNNVDTNAPIKTKEV